MGPDAGDGLGAAGDVGNGGAVVGGEEEAGVADLAAGVGVETGGVEDDLAGFAGGELVDALAVADEGKNASAVEAEGGVAFKLGLGEIAVDGR